MACKFSALFVVMIYPSFQSSVLGSAYNRARPFTLTVASATTFITDCSVSNIGISMILVNAAQFKPLAVTMWPVATLLP
jgi:hypothetical protein